MPTAPSELQASLERHNKTFESLLNLIPPKYYIVKDGADEQVGSDHAFIFVKLNRHSAGTFQVPEE